MRILMTTDFFYPSIGGVESHVYNISYCLAQMGHHVVILTKQDLSQGACGIRYISKNMKVYYLPSKTMDRVMWANTPNLLVNMLFRNIMVRERIDLVHGHSQASNLWISVTLMANFLNIPVVLTQHRWGLVFWRGVGLYIWFVCVGMNLD